MIPKIIHRLWTLSAIVSGALFSGVVRTISPQDPVRLSVPDSPQPPSTTATIGSPFPGKDATGPSDPQAPPIRFLRWKHPRSM